MKINITKNKTLMIVGAIALVFIIWIVADNSNNETPAKNKAGSEKNSKEPAKKAKTEPVEKKSDPAAKSTNSKYINGLLPSDVYGNMNSRGFKTEHTPVSGMGYLWISKMSQADFEYEVTAWSEDDDKKVQSIKATASCASPNEISTTVQFFQMVSTLPYDNSQPQRAARWVLDNFEQNNATITIGGVRFTLFSNSEYSRMLLMEYAN